MTPKKKAKKAAGSNPAEATGDSERRKPLAVASGAGRARVRAIKIRVKALLAAAEYDPETGHVFVDLNEALEDAPDA